MPEVSPGFPRLWIEFADPADGDQDYRCDLTWLTSNWTCIFGRGCAGIVADRPDDGCCTLGAHFSDRADERRVRKWSNQLPAAIWQFRSAARRGGIAEPGEDGDRRTRVVEGACMFLNRPGFAGGAGCALHLLSRERGLSPREVKPDVCWQLPIRREFNQVARPDGTEKLVITIGEYDRAGWGPGGRDLDWYCSGSTEAHVGGEPVFITERDTLIGLMGEEAYGMLVAHCVAHLAALKRAPGRDRTHLAQHPAD